MPSPRRIARHAMPLAVTEKVRFSRRPRCAHFIAATRWNSLTEALAEGIMTGHPAMPQFKLDVAQIGDLIAYLKSLE